MLLPFNNLAPLGLALLLLSSTTTAAPSNSKEIAQPSKPNIVMLLVDDYGWNGVGYHHPENPQTEEAKQAKLETHTPNIDELVRTGVELDRHYAYKICSPSRSSLQTGRHAMHVNALNKGVLVHNANDPISGYQGIPRNMTGVASKLKDGGYSTHMVGKWDAGMATPQHTPHGRGFDSFFGYFQHANNYWNKEGHIEATGDVDLCMNRFTDLFVENSTYSGGCLEEEYLDDSCSGSDENDPSCYEEHIFKTKGLDIINNHNTSDPLFYFHAFHLVHTPLNVPNSYLKKVDDMILPYAFDDAGRRNLSAMIYYMDEVVGEIVSALKSKNMYDNTIIALMGDNGGALYLPGSGNNHPLRGGKYSDWEGGVRTNAFLGGGYIPEKSRGTKYEGIVGIADWYGMFLNLADEPLEDTNALKTNEWLTANRPDLPLLPPVDAIDGMIWNILDANPTNMHEVFPVSPTSIIQYPYKLLLNLQQYSHNTGPLFPNCTSLSGPLVPWHNDSSLFEFHLDWSLDEEELNQHLWVRDCGNKGCLFNIEEDPLENKDLSSDPSYDDKIEELHKLLDLENESLFLPERGEEVVEACSHGVNIGGYYGPFIDIENYYTGPFPKTSEKKERLNELFVEFISVVAKPRIENDVYKIVQKMYPTYMVPPLVRSFDWCLPLEAIE